VALLQQGSAGGVSPDQQLIGLLARSPEYLRFHGNSDAEWVRNAFTLLLGRPTIDTTGSEYISQLGTLVTNYTAARQAALAPVVGSVEFRYRFYTDYYAKYLSSPGVTRVPTAAELVQNEQVYQSNIKRLESSVAYILSTNEYFPLSGV